MIKRESEAAKDHADMQENERLQREHIRRMDVEKGERKEQAEMDEKERVEG